MDELATAHEAWDERWQRAEVRAAWSEPVPLVEALVPLLRQRGLTRVLDVGCGIGRHSLFLATQGLSVVGIDASSSALAEARSQASPDLPLDYREASFYEMEAFAAETFGAVVAWNVIYHGDGDIAQRAIDEFHRVLRPGGLYVGTMLSKRNTGFGVGREVRTDTFVVDDAADDHVHPHYYCDAATLVRLHRGFEVLELIDREQAPGAFHWEFLFERR
ncbi:MAG TPA: class I SAM-dependent methyltransferase [Chloroflexota bacterium]|jgi:SAM-dependent methyltransferase|nr:class I SAM-dependent methyltransferase [Chloroflexota bacterium]